uniref:DNA-directed DNA polymerase n=1 Tax=Ixodes ricinus TaxID=34613 RepID=A0A0K8RJZ7_IXORI
MPKEESTRKLLLTLHDKTKYVLHYRFLKLYIQLGLEVTKIHRVLKFSQRAFLREFIDFNHQLRQQATNSFQKNLSKLFMNSIYGKTIENARKHGHITTVR